jgi:hypothetical protein
MVVIGTSRDEDRIARTFDKSYAYWAIKRDDTWVKWVTDLTVHLELPIQGKAAAAAAQVKQQGVKTTRKVHPLTLQDSRLLRAGPSMGVLGCRAAGFLSHMIEL